MSTSSPPLDTRLRRLRLGYMAQAFEAQNTDSLSNNHSYLEFLEALVDGEIAARESKALMKRIKAARFPVSKTLEEFSFKFQPKLDVKLIKTLATCQFIERKENVIFIGQPGTGKSHLSVALGMKACEADYSVRFTTIQDLAATLRASMADHTTDACIQEFVEPDLVILDELGCAPRSTATPGGMRTHPRPPQRPGEAGGSPAPEVRRSGGSSPDTVGTTRRQRVGPASEAERRRVIEPVVEAPRLVTSPETGGYGLLWCSVALSYGDRLVQPVADRLGEAARRVAVAVRRCHTGKAGRRPCQPVGGERGKRFDGAQRSWAGAPSAVAVGAWRSRRSTPRSGEPATWGRAAANAQHVWVGGGRW